MTVSLDLCELHDIPENDARGFSINTPGGIQEIFIVRKNDEYFGYINRCPHTGVNLDWQLHRFLSLDGTEIQCATHGARFRIRDGFCTWGPCQGQSLVPVSTYIDNNRLRVKTTDHLPDIKSIKYNGK